ncbi:MAG: sulfatase-like hydrolase/transferase [Acidobacteriia bacterium]|nr:sulfatase-like hydrolase/transferase [Terriglobia bacterium]
MAAIRCLFLVVALTASVSATGTPVAPKAPAANPRSPNIVLITLDTTRADRMGFLGSKLGLTPNLDAFANQSSVFTRAYAQAPLTPTSHATILTGTYPQFHQVSFHTSLAKDLPYAPDILRARGYRTAAFVGSLVLDPAVAARGFERGFDTYDAGFHYEGGGEDRYRTVERRGSEVVARALAWLSKHPAGPFFIWIHLYDPHDPYDPPEPYKTRYASEPYDGEIAYVDAVVGKFFSRLKARGLYDNTIITLTSDHGESLGAHGEDTHGIFLYDDTIQVPLLIKLPHARAGGKRIDNRVELVNILPTLLQASRIDIPQQVQGESLLPLMQGEAEEGNSTAWRDRAAYAQSEIQHTEFGWSAEQSLRAGKYLFIQAPRRELYDEAADPKAGHNLASSSAAVADTLATRLETFRQKTTSQQVASTATLDPAAQEKLGALGYMASGRTVVEGSVNDQGADPKDKIEIANMIHRAELMQQDTRVEESIALLEQVLAKEPDLALYAKLGNWMMRQKEYRRAVPVLRKAMEQDRESPVNHLQLAKALLGTGDIEGAVPELEITEAKMPQLVDAHMLLEMAYTKLNRVPDAIRECKMVLQFLPDHYPSYLILGRFLEVSGDLDGAVSNLRKAIALEPQAPDPHVILADVYDHLGRKMDAGRERAAAKRLGANGGE